MTEELTFRSCVIAVSFLGGWSKSQIVFLTPLWFGLGASFFPFSLSIFPYGANSRSPAAHVHHAWETYLAGGRTKQALLQGVFSSSSLLFRSTSIIRRLTTPFTLRSLPIRLHDPLRLVRRFPLHPNRYVELSFRSLLPASPIHAFHGHHTHFLVRPGCPVTFRALSRLARN